MKRHQTKMDQKQPEPKPLWPMPPLQGPAQRARHSSIKISRMLFRNRNHNGTRLECGRNLNRHVCHEYRNPLECGGPVQREAMQPLLACTRIRRQRSRHRLDKPHLTFRGRPANAPRGFLNPTKSIRTKMSTGPFPRTARIGMRSSASEKCGTK